MYTSKNEVKISKLQKQLKKSKACASDLQEKHEEQLELIDVLTDVIKQLEECERVGKKEYEAKTGDCVHTWIYHGHDSHHSYEICIKCSEISKC